ncbi:hypothetical protein BH23ACT5_BH23ACT5_09870 [soil metagenome]
MRPGVIQWWKVTSRHKGDQWPVSRYLTDRATADRVAAELQAAADVVSVRVERVGFGEGGSKS